MMSCMARLISILELVWCGARAKHSQTNRRFDFDFHVSQGPFVSTTTDLIPIASSKIWMLTKHHPGRTHRLLARLARSLHCQADEVRQRPRPLGRAALAVRRARCTSWRLRIQLQQQCFLREERLRSGCQEGWQRNLDLAWTSNHVFACEVVVCEILAATVLRLPCRICRFGTEV